MRVIFGTLAFLVVLVTVAILAKKQLSAVATVPGASAIAGGSAQPAASAPAVPKPVAQQLQQFKQTLDATMQSTSRTANDEK